MAFSNHDYVHSYFHRSGLLGDPVPVPGLQLKLHPTTAAKALPEKKSRQLVTLASFGVACKDALWLIVIAVCCKVGFLLRRFYYLISQQMNRQEIFSLHPAFFDSSLSVASTLVPLIIVSRLSTIVLSATLEMMHRDFWGSAVGSAESPHITTKHGRKWETCRRPMIRLTIS